MKAALGIAAPFARNGRRELRTAAVIRRRREVTHAVKLQQACSEPRHAIAEWAPADKAENQPNCSRNDSRYGSARWSFGRCAATFEEMMASRSATETTRPSRSCAGRERTNHLSYPLSSSD